MILEIGAGCGLAGPLKMKALGLVYMLKHPETHTKTLHSVT